MTDATEKLQALLNDTATIREVLQQSLAEAREERVINLTRRQELDMGLAQLAAAVRGLVTGLDDPSRAGPCLFLPVPRDSNFLKDRGKMFGKPFRLHLFCERLLKPVSFLRGTEECGYFDFEMTHEWWNKLAPYLSATGRLLSTLLPAAGLSGVELSSLTKPVEDIQALAANAGELIDLATPCSIPESPEQRPNDHALSATAPTHAQGRQLTWLHDFLKKACETDDLTTAQKLGLQRVRDKTTGRYLWVHHTQM